jgi:hypothetical protein
MGAHRLREGDNVPKRCGHFALSPFVNSLKKDEACPTVAMRKLRDPGVALDIIQALMFKRKDK